jgi:hypothetical protein
MKLILDCDEAAAVESDDVQAVIGCGLVERAAHGDALAIAAGGGEAAPVGMRRRLAGVAPGLERAAVVGDDVARIEHILRCPRLDHRQLAGRSLRPCRPGRSPPFRVVLKLRKDVS